MIIDFFIRFFNPHSYYFKVYDDKFVMKNIHLNNRQEGLTQVAIDNKHGRIVAIGVRQDLESVRHEIESNAFDCRIVSWFDPIEKTITDETGFNAAVRFSIHRTSPKTLLRSLPVLVLHFVNKSVFYDRELWMIKRLYKETRAVQVYVWQGRDLSDDELSSPGKLKGILFIKRPFW